MNRLYIILLAFTLFGCEEVINLDLNSTNSAIVIEANISNLPSENFVSITQSTDYYNPSTYNTISGAYIVISDIIGKTYLLQETSPGKYINDNLTAIPQNQYTIDVYLADQNYSATSFVPIPILIDSLNYKLQTRPFNKDKKSLELHVFFKDNPNQPDYARFLIYQNGEKLNGTFLYDDRLTNGNDIDFFFFNFNDQEFNSGDTILVEMQTIDKQTHTYFKTLRRALTNSGGGPFGSSAPANPITNWSNNAFGYFSAFTVDKKSIVLE
jgi:hypothetical protein